MMNWIILFFLTYSLIGALLTAFSMRGMMVKAKLNEWIMMVLLWPFCMKFFIHLMFIRSALKSLELMASTIDPSLDPRNEDL